MTVTNSLHQPATAQAGAPKSPVIQVQPLGFPWPTIDPFLFCVYHDDAYPAGNGQLAPAASLAGRQIGQDFSRKDGWSMYHGQSVPGFPPHPHRGFETVTIVRKGLVDHSDSLGAVARFGRGDVQWLTAGSGIVHSEMFPLLKQDEANPLELFQIWLNLPAASKMVAPHFTMFWSQDIPRITWADAAGRHTEVAVIAGTLNDGGTTTRALPPPPDSWATAATADVAIWTLRMAPGARFTLPAATGDGTRRQLYFFKGASVQVGGQAVKGACAVELRATQDIELVNTGEVEAELLMLQGRPIAEPVVQYGPFVMNTQAQIAQTMADYQRTQFGGWSFDDEAPTHGHDPARFAKHPDGREERPAEVPGA
ncbi:pirin family protein [Polaromonas sp. YR568]|uniref:pirin family protein n=1 Tax=Polaromonas sp. YR568 TaxID=1855301 RepID=UPI003138454B